ncbi:acyl-CoA synthetase [Haloarcula salina]|uniref:Benzoate-CoA ligase family protein n=1 Tax=Haloarcula salina TaxID=1429914 RepID=A0AA41GA10_9EURY|nr:benzoate-CoA ligase family protein [Haloarcula salina]MBV0902902.1 benzoate-CoA ligase family protein [Haloarcula salina]
MQENLPESYLPDAANSPEPLHALPETDYPSNVNVAEELVDTHVENGRGDNVAIRFRDRELTYRDLKDRVDRFGNALKDLGVEPGDRVLVRFPNRPEAIVSCLAVQKIGAIPQPSMKLLRAKELTHILDDAKIKLAVVYDDLLDELEDAVDAVDCVEEVVVVDDVGVDHDRPSYQRLIDDASDELAAHDTEATDLGLMLYTSGTTGRPKGAVHSHSDILATADGYANYCLEPTEDDVFGGNPPLPFAYGYGDLVTFPLRFGATTSLVQDATPQTLLEAVEDHGVTVFCSVPTAYNQILSKFPDGHEEYDVSSLRLGLSAGEPLAPHTFDEIGEKYGIDILDGIGTTEMLHIFISHRHTDEIDPEATGFPVPGYEAKIVDPETGDELERGRSGQLAVRGPTGITYWNRPEKQKDAVRDGWSFPGDIFVQREDGRFEYQSREDDLIISSGYNIPGPEVEMVLEEREAVQEVAVIGAPDEERGEIVKAYIVLHEEYEASESLVSELQNYVKNTLAPYKYPRAIQFLDELPRTETGKIQRTKLRDREQTV